MMDYNLNNQDIGPLFSDSRGAGNLRLDDQSAPRTQRGGSPMGTSVSERITQSASPGGSERMQAGTTAATAERGTEDGLMDAPTSDNGDRPRSVPRVRTRKPLVQIATLNVRGCGSPRREERNKIAKSTQWMRANQVGVLALQETYDCTVNFAEAERSNGKVWAFPNPGGTHTAGTGFLIHREGVAADLTRGDFKHEILIEGRLDLLSWQWGGETFTIANLYAPNAPQAAVPFFEKVILLLKRRTIDVILGDWNHVEHSIDRLSSLKSPLAVIDVLSKLRKSLDVDDSWRERNPLSKEYTWESADLGPGGETKRSRLDRILLTPEMTKRSTEHQIDVGLTISDHYPIRVKIIDNNSPELGKPRWKMNLEDLEDEWAMDQCGTILLKCQKDMGRKPMDKWLVAKRSIRSVLNDRQTMRRKERGKHLSELKEKRKNLSKRSDFLSNPGIRHEESVLRERIPNVERGKLDRASESSAARFAEKGESVNKYWFSIGKSIKESSIIRALSTDSIECERDTKAMAEIGRDHHQRLQTAPPLPPAREAAIRKMVNTTSEKRFTPEAQKELDSETSVREATEAIKASQNGKAPGKDGIPYEFYKFWVARLEQRKADRPEIPDVALILSRVWNHVAKGNTAPAEYTEGLMFLLYKKKRRDRIENYRPITLLGCDYKLQTKVMATRLGRNVGGVLHPDQAGFVPGRDILDHVKLAKHVKELCDVTERDGCLVALDQEKAYDRISHYYLWEILEGFGLPETFIRTIQLLYENATTSVLVNQLESAPFEVNRGVRQGDPLSCLLFNLAIEPMAESLRRSNLKGIRIPDVIDRLVVWLFADDTQVYLSKFDKWTTVKSITDEWCLASSAKFNEEKTEFLPMGSASYRKEVCRIKCLLPSRIRTAELLPREARFVKDKQPLRILGGIVGHKVDEAQICEPVVTKIESMADKWSKKGMTLKGRRLIITFLMQSKAQYLMSTNDPPKEVISRVSKAAHKVMWAGKKRGWTTMEVVERPVREGGFGVPNFSYRARTTRLMSAKKWCAPLQERPLWADVVDELIRISSKRPDDPRISSVLWQTWKETYGKTSKLPPDLQAMLKELRRYNVRAEALRFAPNVRYEAPVWLSKTVDLMLKEENSSDMRHLRNFHRVQTMGDLKSVSFVNNQGCKKHSRCIEAINSIHMKTNPRLNARFTTPFLDGANEPDGLDFTQRRKEKARGDMAAGRPTTIDPTFTHSEGLRAAIRIFGEPPHPGTLPAYRQGPPPDRSRTITIWTDGSATDIGTPEARVGFGVWSEKEDLTVASQMTSFPLMNNRAELAAVVWALNKAQTNVPLDIRTDSQYVVIGITKTMKAWENLGWINVVNQDLWRRAQFMIRSRTAETVISKVRAHAGIDGNEKADELAKSGAEGNTEDFPPTEVPRAWRVTGAKLSALDYKRTYEWVRKLEAKDQHTKPRLNLDRIKEELSQKHNMRINDAAVWLSLRKPYIRREISDFLWAMVHGSSQCGSMFSKWGAGWDHLQFCDCGAVESMEHLLTECGNAIWRIRLWREMADKMKLSGIIPEEMCRPPSFVEIMGVGLIRFRSPAATRLWATLVSETAFTVWKLRNRSRFDEIRISTRMAKDLWRTSIEKRARTDLAAQWLKGPSTAAEDKRRSEAVAAWNGLISVKAGEECQEDSCIHPGSCSLVL